MSEQERRERLEQIRERIEEIADELYKIQGAMNNPIYQFIGTDKIANKNFELTMEVQRLQAEQGELLELDCIEPVT